LKVVLADDERTAATSSSTIDSSLVFPDEKKKRLYSQLFFLLQTDPRLVAHLTRLVKLGEIDTLLQTVMFTLYGNQYDGREEHLLLTMFQSVLIHEFDTSLDFGSLMRANTPVSRMMTTYTRRGPGQQYLKYVLHDNLNRLLEQPDLNLEIDPLKVYEQLINQIETETGQTCEWPRAVSADEAASHPEVLRLIRPRIEGLIELANRFLSTIIDSLNEVPYGLRWICKQIRRLTKRKYPESSVWSICSLIGGFFFLRFINPAIVTPQSYMIIDSQPGKTVRRTLTLLAKMLQNLANKPTYNKEMYMMQLSPFVEDNKERITKFLNDLCEVEDFYEVLEVFILYLIVK
jgi:Ras GTPase-activating-like protein IQGAP2/3